MSNNELNMYGISRVDCDVQNCHAWRVSLRRKGRRLVKNFSDGTHGGAHFALQAAMAYRDRLIREYPPITRREFASTKRRHNRSGITGVYRYAKKYKLKDGTEKASWYWEANWPTHQGASEKATYSVNRYGEDIARLLAIRAREEGLLQVEGVFWASERGELHQPETADVTKAENASIDQVA